MSLTVASMAILFLSTPSARRATLSFFPASFALHNFYPRPPRGGRRFSGFCLDLCIDISIHALCEEGDKQAATQSEPINVFLSTPSARRATMTQALVCWKQKISIHALREEGDTRAAATDSTEPDFYPRPPRGGRRFCKAALARSKNFYPRPPRGGRPGDGPHPCRSCAISIHALREEGDEKIPNCQKCETEFLSTPSARRATPLAHRAQAYPAFLSTPSARRATVAYVFRPLGGLKFLSTPSARRATSTA